MTLNFVLIGSPNESVMKANKLNFIIDAASFIVFTFMVSTGVIMHYILPPGSGHSQAIWGMNRHGWGNIHFWLSIAFLIILAFHIIRHWDWIVRFVKGRTSSISGKRTVISIAGLAILLALAISPLLSPISTIENDQHKKDKQTTEQYEDVTHAADTDD